MLEPGEIAPQFELPRTEGETTNLYELEAFTEEGALVLAFYPFDFSPVCTTELCEFRDAEFLTLTPSVDVAAISTDSVYAHRRFSREYDLPFPLLSDTDGSVTGRFGVQYKTWEHHQGVPKRAVFILDSDRRVQYAWATEDAYDDPDLAAIHERLQELPDLTIDEGDDVEA